MAGLCTFQLGAYLWPKSPVHGGVSEGGFQAKGLQEAPADQLRGGFSCTAGLEGCAQSKGLGASATQREGARHQYDNGPPQGLMGQLSPVLGCRPTAGTLCRRYKTTWPVVLHACELHPLTIYAASHACVNQNEPDHTPVQNAVATQQLPSFYLYIRARPADFLISRLTLAANAFGPAGC